MVKKITVLIVDDSSLIRGMLRELLSAEPDIEVLDTAEDPFDAREKIKKLNPDVLTLDVEMPKMDGLSFLEKIMTLRPMPVVMVSTLTGKGTDTAIAALQIGAVECIAKPNVNSEAELQVFARELSAKIRIAAGSQMQARRPVRVRDANAKIYKLRKDAPDFIAIGASTGGVEALSEVLTHLPKETPPIVITQHMPAGFTASFARRLSGLCAVRMIEGVDRMKLEHGVTIIAPGGHHMEVAISGGQFICRINDNPPVNNHKPSVDVLFNSVAEIAGENVLGIILTGMGKDGAQGLLKMRRSGSHTIGQDEASCVVYGMPRAAYELGAVAEVKTLVTIADTIKERCFI
ncbi:MAG: chemotaxis response regulator protein-glutamate methylesterase [Rickettsiales bacterium]|nr:chemotaxis response regulator protein-glutamate methylesterase [Rickettsiales bacterium]